MWLELMGESMVDMSAENVGRIIRHYAQRVVVEVLRYKHQQDESEWL